MAEHKQLQNLQYSCYHTRNSEGEQFVPEHVFNYQIAGTFHISDEHKSYTSKAGDFRLTRRNHLVKYTKTPPEYGDFKSISVYLDQETLKQFSIEYGYKAEKRVEDGAVIELNPHPLYKSYMDSLLPYEGILRSGKEHLFSVKLQEAILLLLQVNPELKDILFDFNEPGKIDLEAFMNRNFHFNVEMKRFAYLTGRSLATFKRDFEKIFKSPPSRWLLPRRLQEAYYRIREKGIAPSDVYLDLGFKDLSHFFFAFKKLYGVAPSKLI